MQDKELEKDLNILKEVAEDKPKNENAEADNKKLGRIVDD